MYKRVTRADVASRAGVSETIVSYVINKNRYVSHAKREQVEEAIRELNYHPNNIARALKGKDSNHILFIADQIDNEHFGKLIAEMDRFAYDKGIMVSLCANRNDNEFLSQIISHQYDGIIISSNSFPREYIEQLAARLPVVLLQNRDYGDIHGAAVIGTGLYNGARDCVRHLVERGRRAILYLSQFSERGDFDFARDMRFRGFIDQMNEFGIPVLKNNIITGCRNPSEVSKKLHTRLSGGKKADAIFGHNDYLACIGMKTALEMGFRIPEDIAVIGFDNSNLSRYTMPTLSTLEINRAAIGGAAIEMLQQMIKEKIVPESVDFPAILIPREST